MGRPAGKTLGGRLADQALQRARATLAEQELAQPGPGGDTAGTLDADHQALLTRYAEAFERYDVGALVSLMHEGVTSGRIDTVRAEHTPEAMGRDPRDDDHGGEVYVYRRAGLPCLVCGTPVLTRVLGGRNLFWCPECQRADRLSG